MANLKIAFDIGGVLSKYPETFKKLIAGLWCGGVNLYVITDMHKRDEVLKQLSDNGFSMIPPENVYCADYNTHGEFCKAVLLRDLKIDIFFDDFVGYVNWDSQFGEAPIRCLLAPNAFKPYWDESWKCEGGEFGRRKFSPPKKEG